MFLDCVELFFFEELVLSVKPQHKVNPALKCSVQSRHISSDLFALCYVLHCTAREVTSDYTS